jgi:para-aminobenzoate synthetase/4-amino-4-deoxychorismate lyase
MSSTRDGGNLPRWKRLPESVYKLIEESPGAILLESSRFDEVNQHSFLFLNPVTVIAVYHLHEIPELFIQIEEALAKGLYVAGYMSYECGYHFEPLKNDRSKSGENGPLAWFGIYSDPFVFDHARGCFTGAHPELSGAKQVVKFSSLTSHELTLDIAEEKYCGRILEIKERIAAGDTYQVNFTDKISFPLEKSPAAIFKNLAKRQPVSYSAFLNAADHHVLSFSPELFFRTENGKITTRPMKGTTSRGLDLQEDSLAMLWLQNDEKNRAEHVMIVDLLRNDLGRICETGSIHVDGLFSIEKYQTLFQMTSTVSGTLREGIGYYDIFKSLFPSGSVTGAPKVRTMEIIHELERSPRGIYAGAIGFIAPQGKSVFNVAIRTLVMKDGRAQMGVGGGIVADSDPEDEYRECLLKASFLTRTQPKFQLIETMLWKNEFFLLSMHLDRVESSAAYFGFAFDREEVLSQLQTLSQAFITDKAYRVRLLVSSAGKMILESAELCEQPETITAKLSDSHVSSSDVFARHKTTQRQLHDRELAEAQAKGFDEVLFQNERGEITEGAISNIFIRQSSKLITPPVACGVLPGVFRRYLLETDPAVEEKIIAVKDLKTADAVYLCNSVRGLREVKSICFDGSIVTCSKAHA